MLTLTDIQVPHDAQFFLAADTGTFLSALLTAIDSDHHAYVLAEFPNYRYVSDQCELNNITNPEWCERVVKTCHAFKLYRPQAWVDTNSQFKAEFRNHGLHLLGSKIAPETRVSIAREYFQNDRVHLAPWLRVLPYELEHAKWPEEASSTGRFMRVKRSDHTLDCLEHILSRRPRGADVPPPRKKQRLADEWLAIDPDHPGRGYGNAHLGRN